MEPLADALSHLSSRLGGGGAAGHGRHLCSCPIHSLRLSLRLQIDVNCRRLLHFCVRVCVCVCVCVCVVCVRDYIHCKPEMHRIQKTRHCGLCC